MSLPSDAIMSEPAWEGGWYRQAHAVREGLRRHSRLWAVMGLSAGLLKSEFWRTLGFSSLDDFLLNFLDASFLPMDPNNLLSMARKWQDADVSRHAGGDLAAALGRIKAKTMVMPISSDMFFVTADCAAEQGLIRGSELRVLETPWGHIGLFGMNPNYVEQVDTALGELLARPL
jgi:homoserine O-acetyltransferase